MKRIMQGRALLFLLMSLMVVAARAETLPAGAENANPNSIAAVHDSAEAAPTVSEQPVVSEQAAASEQAAVTSASQNSAAPEAVDPSTAPTSGLRLKQEAGHGEPGDMGSASVQMVLGLAAVLAVILGLAWVAKRFNLNGTGGIAGMRVAGALPVGPKEKILLVEVEGKRLLLGVTAHQITLLQSAPAGESGPAGGEFADKIQALLKTGTLHEK